MKYSSTLRPVDSYIPVSIIKLMVVLSLTWSQAGFSIYGAKCCLSSDGPMLHVMDNKPYNPLFSNSQTSRLDLFIIEQTKKTAYTINEEDI